MVEINNIVAIWRLAHCHLYGFRMQQPRDAFDPGASRLPLMMMCVREESN
jgi:hypothetical protein